MTKPKDPLASALTEYARHPERYYAHAYTSARAGNHADALELLHGFVDAVDVHKPIPQPIMDYLSAGFSQYLANGDLDLETALLLKRPRHRESGRTRDAVPIVADLYLRMKRDGLSKTAAKTAVCSRWHVEERALERYDRENNLIRTWDIPTLEQMAQPIARAPARR